MSEKRYDVGALGKPHKRPDGTMRVDGYLTRAGVFTYRNPDGSKRLEYRPPEEVMHADSLASAACAVVTNDHPPEQVSAANARQYAVGTVGDNIRADGKLVRGSLVIFDADAIGAMQKGKRQLSCGYTCDVEDAPGVTPDGERYDAVQRNIRYNHVALVDIGRAGPEASVRMDAAEAPHADWDPDQPRSEDGKWGEGGGGGDGGEARSGAGKKERFASKKEERQAEAALAHRQAFVSEKATKAIMSRDPEAHLEAAAALRDLAVEIRDMPKPEDLFDDDVASHEREREASKAEDKAKWHEEKAAYEREQGPRERAALEELEKKIAEAKAARAARSKGGKRKRGDVLDTVTDRLDAEENITMNMKKVRIDGVDYDVPEQAAQVLERERVRADKAEADVKSANAERDAAKARADQAAEDLAKEKKLRADAEASFPERVQARVALENQAREVLGADTKLDGLDDKAVKLKVLAQLSPDFKADKKSDDYINARYDAAVERVKNDEDDEHLAAARVAAEGKPPKAGERADAGDPEEAARQRMIAHNRNLSRGRADNAGDEE